MPLLMADHHHGLLRILHIHQGCIPAAVFISKINLKPGVVLSHWDYVSRLLYTLRTDLEEIDNVKLSGLKGDAPHT